MAASTPRIDVGITNAGFPDVGTRNLPREAVQFGILCGSGLFSSINDRQVPHCLTANTSSLSSAKASFRRTTIRRHPRRSLIHNVMTDQQLLVNALCGAIVAGPNPSARVRSANRPDKSPWLRQRRAYSFQPASSLNAVNWFLSGMFLSG
jgi:hypothetical protein